MIIQVHYHPSGKPEVDRTRLGLYYAREPIQQALHWNQASNFEFRLPAGKANIEVEGSWFVPADVEALAVSPHMHMLGRDMRMFVKFPNGRHPGPDPHPQLGPRLAEHLLLPGADLHAQGLGRQGHRPLRQLGALPQPEPALPSP